MYWADNSEGESDESIGEIPHHYNYLVEYYHDRGYNNLPAVIHYTEGGPWHPGYETCEYGDLWMAYLTPEESDQIFAEREDLRKEMETRYSKEQLLEERNPTKCTT